MLDAYIYVIAKNPFCAAITNPLLNLRCPKSGPRFRLRGHGPENVLKS